MPDLRTLNKQEHQLRKSLEGIQQFVSGFQSKRDAGQVSVRLEALDKLFSQFLETRLQIELLLEDAVEDGDEEALVEQNDKVQQNFENCYYALKSELQAFQSIGCSTLKNSTSQAPDAQSGTQFAKVKLPEIKLPSFTGKINEWVPYRDSFRSLIHDSNLLTEVDKFTYLMSSLSGDALQEINCIDLSAANYAVAWKALESRYENKKLIVKAHLDALFAVEALKKESYEELNRLISAFEKNLQMLEKIGEKPSDWSTILAYMVCSRLDMATLRHWETHHNSKEVAQYPAVMDFLKSHCSVLQSIAPSRPTVPIQQRQSRPAVCNTSFKSTLKCHFCSEPRHSVFQCARFQRMSVPERIEAANRNKLCRNCLYPGHFARTCEKGTCHQCHQKHHTLLHSDAPRSSVPPTQSRPSTVNQQPRQPQSKPPTPNQQTRTANTANTPDSHTQPATEHATTSQTHVALPITPTQTIILSTALVSIQDRYGNPVVARALLDSCSQHCLMTRGFASKLKLDETPVYLSIQGIGSSQAVSTKLITAVVGPRSPNISSFVEEMSFHVLPKLTVSLPTASICAATWNLPNPSLLADPKFFEMGPIDIIIGAEYYMELLKNERRKATDDGPTLQDTVFGWIVSGPVPEGPTTASYSLTHVCSTAEIQDQLSRFWEVETCQSTSTLSVEESACEEFFDRTTFRDEDGRYVVTLPKKERMIQQLGDSRSTAIKRFLGVERRLAMNPELKKQYAEFMCEYLDMGHMKELSDDDASALSYYLPHHAILKPDSTTTKLRVVFDASCKTSSGISLNDALMVGPVVQDMIVDITLRFRTHRFALVGDVAKMYRMVLMNAADQQLQRIVWRDSASEPIRTFALTTVTYGTASAPYLATKCLQRLAEEGEKSHPAAAKVLRKDFYVDDMLSGVDDIEEGKTLVGQMVELLQSAGFSLRKWNSNSKELLSAVPEGLRDERSILEVDSSTAAVKTLGLTWEPSTDCFRFSSPVWNEVAEITKRCVLSDASRLFDPLGLVGPVIIQAKIFLQDLWKHDCEWDEPLSSQLQEQWREYRRNLAGLDGIAVPRWVGTSRSTETIELHGFCDASNKAYGACVYVRTVTADGNVSVHLLTSKSRVAPLENLKKNKKSLSTPRLELSSALLLAHLYEKVAKNINVVTKCHFWTDSTIVVCWLSSSPVRWKQFVANRVSEIQHITKGSVWKHVAGEDNPANIISRGMSPAQLQYESRWFHGPKWLMLDNQYWPNSAQIDEGSLDQADLEEKAIVAALPAVSPSEIFGLRSSLVDLVRLTVHIRRFKWNSSPANRSCRKVGCITSQEYDDAVKELVKLSQRECFPQEFADIARHGQVQDSSRISNLNPQLVEGVLCVGGRLKNAAVPDGRKHPYILDHRHPFTRIVVVYYHRKHFHAGQQQVVTAVRERFWPTSARNLARQVIHEYVQCFRAKPKIQEQLMADLPPERVRPCFPFQKVGVDYCGPFHVVYPQRRARPINCFVAVYVCLITKAVHLELAADLSTQAFLATLHRFTARRGKPSLIMCDNGTNFVGARRKLDELAQLFASQQFTDAVLRQTIEDRIEFRFIPARSPNFGGLWESAVKSFKTLFKRTIGTRSLEYDRMQTVLAQTEAILNSRPLTPISNDPDDFEALTPGHFLIQRPLTAIPGPDLGGVPENRLSAWERMTEFTQRLWKKWSEQYLSNLHNRTKWTRQRNNIAVGTMVVLKEENLPPLKWQLARVTEVHPGSDGNIRVVTVRTKDGSYQRAISKICVLPIRDNFPSGEGEN
ncbi:uncharacterized protein LOC134286035 [Aedes albopictus]|uniref:Integrase catalytic domain-containing protein n=1 Tax=Aedes albopictus TaxID=7160 RepID=A0ABM1ZU96_AEDAL